jgi:hypothetical protein
VVSVSFLPLRTTRAAFTTNVQITVVTIHVEYNNPSSDRRDLQGTILVTMTFISSAKMACVTTRGAIVIVSKRMAFITM